MQNKRITKLANATSSNDAVTLGQFEAVVPCLTPLTGGCDSPSGQITSSLESLDMSSTLPDSKNR